MGQKISSISSISPAFDANTTSYTASVPFSVSKLDIRATAQDSKAKTSINNPSLVANGKTNVTVTVQAENGEKKTYTSLLREQLPMMERLTINLTMKQAV